MSGTCVEAGGPAPGASDQALPPGAHRSVPGESGPTLGVQWALVWPPGCRLSHGNGRRLTAGSVGLCAVGPPWSDLSVGGSPGGRGCAVSTCAPRPRPETQSSSLSMPLSIPASVPVSLATVLGHIAGLTQLHPRVLQPVSQLKGDLFAVPFVLFFVGVKLGGGVLGAGGGAAGSDKCIGPECADGLVLAEVHACTPNPRPDVGHMQLLHAFPGGAQRCGSGHFRPAVPGCFGSCEGSSSRDQVLGEVGRFPGDSSASPSSSPPALSHVPDRPGPRPGGQGLLLAVDGHFFTPAR